ncbi:MAG: efflux RND transporter periplasmic adaptor subunit [bacterium]
MKKVVIIAVALGGLGAGWFLFSRHNEPKSSVGSVQQVARVTRGDLNVTVSATGVIEPINKVEIKSKASGLIEELPVEEGDSVEKGDLIARLDQTDVRHDYEQAKADLEVAEATVRKTETTYKRKAGLFEKGLVSAEEMDQSNLELVQAKAQLVRAKAVLATAEERLKDTVVKSPISGIVLQKNVEKGQIISSGISSVSGGTLIATVADMGRVSVKADIDEVDIGQIEKGQEAKVVADAFPGDLFWGEVIRIAPLAKVEQNVTIFEVTVEVNNEEAKLKAGMNATVDITIADRKDVLLVPNEALKDLREMVKPGEGYRHPSAAHSSRADIPKMAGHLRWQEGLKDVKPTQGGRPKMVMVKEGGQFKPRAIIVGVSDFDHSEALKGLKEGDEVMISYLSRAKMDSEQFRERFSRMRSFGGIGRSKKEN